MTDTLTKTAPPRIWLQVDYSGVGDRSEPFPTDLGDISWCKDSVGGLEVEYVRADLSEDRWLDGYYEGFKEANRLAYQSPGKRWLDHEPDATQLVEALEQIARWDGFPSTDKVWEGSGEPVSYGVAFGSNGERDFMREVARKALAAYHKQEPSHDSQ